MPHPTDVLPSDALCERCYTPVRPTQRYARLGHITGTPLTGDIRWAHTFLHVYDRDTGCATTPADTGGAG
ncbi:MAG: hypothetical protein L0H84_20775 [Pseudonocardia sp.]|nr:hypothetical protein [Pseudonocardia sp.]